MNLAFFIARRTAAHPENKPGVMERIAVISVALSVAVMLPGDGRDHGVSSRRCPQGGRLFGPCRGRRAGCGDARFGARAPQCPHRGLIRTTEGFVSLAPMPSRAVSYARRMPCR
ncbi:MAG: hypothetical protein ACLRM8_00390 [Alistipes sp.]